MYFNKVISYKNDLWRYIITLFTTIFSYMVLGAIPFGVAIIIQASKGIPIDMQEFAETADPALLDLDQNIGLILLLFPMVLSFFVLLLLMIKVHAIPLGDIASAFGRIRWKRLFSAMLLWLLFLVISEIILYSFRPEIYQYQFDIDKFIPLVVIVLLLIPFQAWFEELFFRSYLMRGIGLLIRYRWVAVLLTAAAFGLVHGLNPEVKEYGTWATMPFYVGFGLFTGLLVVFDKGIEMACGIHAINNIYGSLVVTYESSALKTSAIWSITDLNISGMNLAFTISAVAFLLIMVRKQQWQGWRILFEPIHKDA